MPYWSNIASLHYCAPISVPLTVKDANKSRVYIFCPQQRLRASVVKIPLVTANSAPPSIVVFLPFDIYVAVPKDLFMVSTI